MIANKKNLLNLETIKVKPKGVSSDDDEFSSQGVSGTGTVPNFQDQRTVKNKSTVKNDPKN